MTCGELEERLGRVANEDFERRCHKSDPSGTAYSVISWLKFFLDDSKVKDQDALDYGHRLWEESVHPSE